MAKISTIAKKLLDKDLRVLVEAGWLDSELAVNEAGVDALIEMLFMEKKTELAKEAALLLKEKKEEEDK